jgi:hypothetical protein
MRLREEMVVDYLKVLLQHTPERFEENREKFRQNSPCIGTNSSRLFLAFPTALCIFHNVRKKKRKYFK